MKKNMGVADRAIRTIVAVVLIVLLVTGKVSSTLAIVLGVIAAAFVVTSLMGWCPAYIPLKMSTRKNPGAAPPKA